MPVAQQLGNQAYSILLDLPGHGHNTNWNIDQPLTFDQLAAELANLFEHLRFTTVDLVGYSMGGRLALYFALQYPHKVRNLILESANPGIIMEKDREDRRAKDAMRAEDILMNGMARFVDKWYRMPLFNTLNQYGAQFDRLKTGRKKNDPDWMAKVVRELSPGNQPHVWDQLQLLKKPVLLITGGKDEKYLGITKKMAEAIPNANVSVLDNAGHNCHFELCEEYGQVLWAYLSRNVPSL